MSSQPPPPNRFSAAEPAIGYLYQMRVALLWALRRLKESPDFMVSLETLDDVVFEKSGKAKELIQTKHRRSAALTNASPDLWKSLRVWFEGFADKSIPPGTVLHLLTTASAPPGCVAAHLRQTNRNVQTALAMLEATAQTSRNLENAAAYAAFLKTAAPDRGAILDAVFVIDAGPNISDLDEKLRTEVFWAVERRYLNAFLEYLEGWWLRRTVTQLLRIKAGDRILAQELESQMSDLREQFKQDSFPIANDLLNFAPDDGALAAHEETIFVRQLHLVKAGKLRIAAAIRDYYRAFVQRSRWMREELLMVGELENYERKLVEEWELVFEAMKDNIGSQAADAIKEGAARGVLEWAEGTSFPIRPAVTEPFVTRGSMHMLADDLRVGWHAEFRDRLAHLLTPETARA
jgi:hypothetical protein